MRMMAGRSIAIAIVSLSVLGACTTSVGGSPTPTTSQTARPAATPTQRPSAPANAGYLYDPTADARADVQAAFAEAKASGKRVLIDYGADWCPDCHSLAAFMDGAAGRALIDPAFVVVKVDVGFWDHNLDIAGEYGNAISNGIPAVVVYAANGKLIGSSADGSLANARAMTEGQVLAELAAWAE